MRDKWIEVANDLSAADAESLSVEEALALLARVQDMENAARVILMRAVAGSGASTASNKKVEEEVYECVEPPEVLSEDDLIEVKINASEIDAEGACIRRRVEALDLGRTAWGKLKVVNSGGGYGHSRANPINPYALDVLADALKRYSGAFVEVDMTGAPLTAEEMGVFAEKVLQNNATLRVLGLDNSVLGLDGTAFLAGFLRHSKDSALTTLKLNYVNMDDAALTRFCNVIRADDAVPKLAALYVAGNSFSSLKPLTELVKAKPTLREISIANVKAKEADGFGQAVAGSNIEHLRAHCIQEVNFAKEAVLSAKGNKLTHLKIQADKLDKEDYDALGAAIGASTSMHILEVDMGNVMKMPSREGFFAGIGANKSLEELLLYQSRLDDEASKQLARAIAKHPTLQKVKAAGCNTLKGPCAQTWADAIEASTTLCDLELETNWKDDELLSILDALANSLTLQKLKLGSSGNYKLQQAITALMEDDPKAEELVASFCAENAKKKGLKQEHDIQVAKQGSLAIRQFSTGDKVMVVPGGAAGTTQSALIAGCVVEKDADNWYKVTRDDGEPTLRCVTLKQIRPRAGYHLPPGCIVDATALGGREYRAKIVEALPDDKYKILPFWNSTPEKEGKTVERYQLSAVLPS